MVRRLSLTLLLIITDATAIFHFIKDHKHQYGHEEVDHYNYHHQYHHENHKHHNHKHHNHKHHEHKYSDHTIQDHKHHEHKESEHKYHKYHDHKQPEHKYVEHKLPQQTHIRKQYENHYFHNHGHNNSQSHKHQEEHKLHNHKQQDLKKYREHVHQEHNYKHQDQLHEQPHYEFKYGVRDPSTGDFKNQWEIRQGDNVLGEYSFVEADGTIRTVQYTAGKYTGFNAIVKKEGKAKHPVRAEVPYYKEVLLQQQVKASNKLSGSISKAVFPESSNDKTGHGLRNRLYFEVDSPGRHYLIPPNVPVNHRPVFSGIDEDSDFLAFYRRHPVHSKSPSEVQSFDYDINEYLSKRSYDLNKISESLNVNTRRAFNSDNVSNLRVVRGSFAMGR